MNNDVYAEWLVARKDKWFMIPLYILAGLLLCVAVLLTITTSYGVFILLILAALVVLLSQFNHVEYEYIFVTSELSIDRIYNQKRRKKGPRVDMSAVETVEKTNKIYLDQQIANKQAVIENFTSGVKGEESYMIIYTGGGKRHILLFQPNDKLLHTMWRSFPSKVHIERK